jgi:hypothetical protein
MDHLDHPTEQIWDERRNWFEAQEAEFRGGGSYIVSEQACALIVETQSVFCAGAWIAVVILAIAVIDAQLRETEVPGFEGSTFQLLDEAGANPATQYLRKRRNELVHLSPENPAITVDQQWGNRVDLEADAREAVILMFQAFYTRPWV